MFNSLQDKLDKALHSLSGRGKITEINVAETIKEIRRALVDADVNYKIAKDLTKRVQDKAIGQNVLTSLTPGQLMTKIVHTELVELMGGTQEGINLSGRPTIILIAGLQGSGKTTFSGKLANYLKTKKAMEEVCALVIDRKMSVRELEEYVAKLLKPREVRKTKAKDIFIEEQENILKKRLGTSVTIKQGRNKKGKIEIEFKDNDEFERIISLFKDE